MYLGVGNTTYYKKRWMMKMIKTGEPTKDYIKVFETMDKDQREMCLWLCEYMKGIETYNEWNKNMATNFIYKLYDVDHKL